MVFPVMNQKAVLFVSVEPSRINHAGDKKPRFPVPLNPRFDGLIGIFADVAARRKAAGKVPHGFKPAHCGSLGLSEHCLQTCEFWVVRYGT